jgi:hypothetical protein
VDLNWLVTGTGERRPPGLVSGAALAHFVVVDQYETGAALSMSVITGQVPFSRHYLESKLRLEDPHNETLLVVEADANLFEISRGDLVLVDRNQNDLGRDGIYLLDLPGIVLRAITRCVGDKLRVTQPEHDGDRLPKPARRGGRQVRGSVEELRRSELLADGHSKVSKVVGRAIWIGRAI